MRTPGYYALAHYAQGGTPATGPGEVNTDIIYLVVHASPVAKVVLAILLLFSAISWGIVLYKFWQFGRSSRQSSTFLDVFRKSSKFSEVQAVCRTLSASPLVGLFQSGYTELIARDRTTGERWRVDLREFVTERQERMMVQDPFMVRSLARHVAAELRTKGRPEVEVRAESFASLNGRPPTYLIDPRVDLAGPVPADWILPLNRDCRAEPRPLLSSTLHE